ncbi:tudor domain-containing protein 6-like [Poecilia latipinna]|uniref:tudor domain-containing protein 6-like n=1 Tax=Poecilia latipinna TaxID=48699 RepID=UPI00072DA6B4|nr:PREDICTED: tudor domain-containing protein 6-like [Poecilia latipinna]
MKRSVNNNEHGFDTSSKPEDPAILRVNAQAFQYFLFSVQKPISPKWAVAARRDFQNFMNLDSVSGPGLKYVRNAVTSEADLEQNVVDVESGSKSLPKHLAQSCDLSETGNQSPPEVPVDEYHYSTHNIKVGGEEKILVTFSESVHHFYCQLDRNLHMLEKLWKSVALLPGKHQSSDCPLGPNSICLAKYTDNQWYRGLIVERFPNLKVHFVDYGDTLAVLETDIRPLPPEASIARSVPVQAVPLGLFNVPADLSLKINEWFAYHAVGNNFTISVAAKGKKGKLLVELFDGSLNVNALVREKVTKMRRPKMTAVISNTDDEFSVSKKTTLPDEDHASPELTRSSMLKNTVPEMQENKKMCPTYASSPKAEQVKDLDIILENNQSRTETLNHSLNSNLEMTQFSSHNYPKQNAEGYNWPNISQNMSVDAYASCISGPHYFWCQHANTEDLDKVSCLANEVAKAQDVISPEHLKPGVPCLALLSEDNKWYRAQVTENSDNTVHVLFVDYGNECDVEKKDVRSLSQNLLEMAPQAFLCRLDGFMESSGFWDNEVYDDFYNLIVDKPLKVTVVAVGSCSENGVPQHTVTTECDKIVVNKVIQKYWKSFSGEHSIVAKDFQASNSKDNLGPSKEMSTFTYKQPEVFKTKTEMVYASCIVEPKFFWCQFANTEDLCEVSQLAQEAGKAQQDVTFLQSLGPGSHCLALFPDDKLWCRAMVVQKDNRTVHVLFVDYGNESDIDIQDTRPLPQNLLEKVPQAFLCRLIGFDESKGSWDDQVYDFFYKLLVDKPLKLTVFNAESHSEMPVPQYAVEVECELISINASLQQYWKPFTEECAVTENLQTSSCS